MYEIDASVVRRSDTLEVVGVALEAGPETNSELFCHRFPKALSSGHGNITVEGRMLQFKMENARSFEVELHEMDARDLSTILDRADAKWDSALEGVMTPGFRITLADVSTEPLIEERINGWHKGEVQPVRVVKR